MILKPRTSFPEFTKGLEFKYSSFSRNFGIRIENYKTVTIR